MTRHWPALAVFAAVTVSANATPFEPPYLGAWDCDVAVFWFTPHGYDNGSSIMPIRRVEKSMGKYTLSFDGGYKIALFDITNDEMSWYSQKSGDFFKCRRVSP